MTPFHVQSKVCIASRDGSNADFAPHMKFSFRDQIVSKTASFANFQRELFKIMGVYMTYVTTFDYQNILKESTVNQKKTRKRK